MKQPEIEDLPGFVDLFHKSIKKAIQAMPIEERLAGLSPEQLLAGLTPEQRLAGLAPEQVILALPLDVLRVLPAEVQEQIQKRLREAAH
jgi:hypothetical protein